MAFGLGADIGRQDQAHEGLDNVLEVGREGLVKRAQEPEQGRQGGSVRAVASPSQQILRNLLYGTSARMIRPTLTLSITSSIGIERRSFKLAAFKA